MKTFKEISLKQLLADQDARRIKAEAKRRNEERFEGAMWLGVTIMSVGPIVYLIGSMLFDTIQRIF